MTLGGIALCLRRDRERERGKKRERIKKARNRDREERNKKLKRLKNKDMEREGWKKEKYLPRLPCLIHHFLMRIVTAYIFQCFIII